jgi:signal transduction histidine kinase/HAMP domain-containing protein
MTREELADATRAAESALAENLGDLLQKTLFLSEMKEVIDNIDQPDELAMTLGFKFYFFPNTNILMIAPDGSIVHCHENSSLRLISQSNLRQIAFRSPDHDPLTREAGIFLVNGGLCMAAISPMIDQESFELKGFTLMENPFNLEFADQIKKRCKAEIMLLVQDRRITSTLTDSSGEMLFPGPEQMGAKKMIRFQPGGDRYLINSFPVEDFRKRKVGTICVGVNVERIMAAKQVSTSSLMLGSLLVGLIIILASILLGRRITSPIIKLSRGAEAIARGNFNVSIQLNSKDEIGELAGVFNNMSNSLQIQRNEIRELQQFFENIIAYSPSAIVIGNASAEVIAMNPAAEKLLDRPLAQLKNQPLFEMLPALNPLKEDYFQVLLSGNPRFIDNYLLRRESESEKALRLTLYKIPLPDAPAAVLQIEDISEKLELEEKLVQAKKLGTMGELLSRFTHEFNNLMASLLGHITLFKKETSAIHLQFRQPQLIEDVALRAVNLGRDMLDFSKREKLKKETLHVPQTIETVLDMLGKTILKKIEVETNWSGNELTVLINKEKFLLALFNMLINAKDAIGTAQRENGWIRIAVDRLFIPKAEKDFIRINIADNGTGVDDKIISKIFEPYFTTKGAKGNGLGLSSVKEIIEENGGWIEIESEKDRGTTFRIFLPQHRG